VDRSSTPASFLAEYDAVLAGWPVTVERIELRSRYGTTRVNACGPPGRPPLVLLSGGGAPSAVWYANIGELSRAHRIYAIDALGDRGRSVYDGDPVTGLADLMAWLDSCLGVTSADVCAHSYRRWIALRYALHAPQRVARLVLLDPTQCFSGQRLTYRLHTIDLFARPGPESRRRFFTWETAGAIDPRLLALMCLPFSGKSPARGQVRLAEASRRRGTARALVPHVATSVLPGATHHTMPAGPAAELNRHLTAFLA
jgi:pimeloyl-ACP methyl ester carboxylesterase